MRGNSIFKFGFLSTEKKGRNKKIFADYFNVNILLFRSNRMILNVPWVLVRCGQTKLEQTFLYKMGWRWIKWNYLRKCIELIKKKRKSQGISWTRTHGQALPVPIYPLWNSFLPRWIAVLYNKNKSFKKKKMPINNLLG